MKQLASIHLLFDQRRTYFYMGVLGWWSHVLLSYCLFILSRLGAAQYLAFRLKMQLVCIYVCCLHRWTSTLRSTWTRSPFRIPWMKSSNTCISVCDVSSCAWMWLIFEDFTREKDELDFTQCVLSSELFVFEHFIDNDNNWNWYEQFIL